METDEARIKRLESEKQELVEALTVMLTSFATDPDSSENEVNAYENGIQTIEKLYGMPFMSYLKEVAA